MALSNRRACKKHDFLKFQQEKLQVCSLSKKKSNKTIQRHKSDTAIDPMPMGKILIDMWFIFRV